MSKYHSSITSIQRSKKVQYKKKIQLLTQRISWKFDCMRTYNYTQISNERNAVVLSI